DQLEARLGRGGEDRAHRHVVGAGGYRCPRLLGGVGGDAEEHAGAEERSGDAGGEIVLPEVDTVRLDRDGEVDAVVDDERHPRGRAAAAQPLGQRQQPARRPLLFPKLDHPAAGGDGALEDPVEFPAPGRRAVEDHVEIRDQGRHRRAAAPGYRVVSRRPRRNPPSRNAGSLRSLWWNGIVVFTPSTTVSASARRIRSIAVGRSSAWTMI